MKFSGLVILSRVLFYCGKPTHKNFKYTYNYFLNFDRVNMAEQYGVIGFFVMLFLVVLAILWFLLPFAIFGTKALLQELIDETKKNNELLSKLVMSSNNDANQIQKTTKARPMPDDIVIGG